jgi:hypothetical protein
MNHPPPGKSEEQTCLRRDRRLQQAKAEYEKAERWYGYSFAGLFLLIPITIWRLLHTYIVGLFAVNPESIAVSITVAAVSLIAGSSLASLFASGKRKRRDRARETLERIEKESEN